VIARREGEERMRWGGEGSETSMEREERLRYGCWGSDAPDNKQTEQGRARKMFTFFFEKLNKFSRRIFFPFSTSTQSTDKKT
jgi:hypothetical protein